MVTIPPHLCDESATFGGVYLVIIGRIPIFHDNYVFVLHMGQQAVVVDPGDAEPVLEYLKAHNLTLQALWITHHHPDHVGGISDLLQQWPEAVVYGSHVDQGRIPGQQVGLRGGEHWIWGQEVVEVLFIPGHTRGHVAYYLPGTGDLFCGDTLFAGGCGRMKEGDCPEQFLASLQQIRPLPPTTMLWCAHEYTLANLRFALTVEPDNEDLRTRLQQVSEQRQHGQATVPTPLAIEKATNPFLRWDEASVQEAMGTRDPVEVFRRLRHQKDCF